MKHLELTEQEARVVIPAVLLALKGSCQCNFAEDEREALLVKVLALYEQVVLDASKRERAARASA